ncbi:hypothetical protein T484DRAFT_1814332 [Baffinella frigidus]|nr:hypothetical protein T484DRAFT_1814332 [Cryptophyta sp. CCMP2293]
MNIRSAAIVPVLLLAAALSADGAETALVADTASASMTITEGAPMQFFTFTPASNESTTFIYTTDGDNVMAFAKWGGCPTRTDYHFENERYASNRGEVYVDPCSGSGYICIGVTYWDPAGAHPDTVVTATAKRTSALGAFALALGSTIASATLRSGMTNLKITLPSDFDAAASFLRLRWENLESGSSTSAEFYVNQEGMCPTQKDAQPATITRQNMADGFDSALTLGAGAVVRFGIKNWGEVTHLKLNVTLEDRTCTNSTCQWCAGETACLAVTT